MERTLILWFLASAVLNAAGLVPNIKLNDGREMPAFGLGTWLGNSSQGRIEAKGNETEQAVRWALQAGYRHIDTAWIYKVEDQVRRAISAELAATNLAKELLFVTTKLWNNAHARDAVVPALRQSLKNLNLDYVDLYLIHWPVGQYDNKTYDNTDYIETWKGMIEAKELGLTKSIGLSNFNQEMMERIKAEGLQKPAVLQVEINLNNQQPDLLAYCKQENIAVVAYTPFGSLFYTKAKSDAPPPRIDEPALVDLAHKYNKTVPQVVLRYLVELGVVPIPKSNTKKRIEENIQIFDFNLTEEERNLLKSYDRAYRTIPQLKWLDHPYYPFEKPNIIKQ